MIRDYLIFFVGLVGGLLVPHVGLWTCLALGFGAGLVINLTRKD